MYIFKRKQFLLILCFLFLSFSIYFASNENNIINTTNRSYDITQVSALPVTEKVVVIDAGHGGEDERC